MGNACFTPSGQSAELEHDKSKDKNKKQMTGATKGEERKYTVTAKTIKKEEEHHRQPSNQSAESMHTVDL